MNSLGLCKNAIFILCLLKVSCSDAYRAYKERDKQMKIMDMEYGERLSSVENVRNRLLLKGSGQKKKVMFSTRCTTDKEILLDRDFVIDSDGNSLNNNEPLQDVSAGSMNADYQSTLPYISPAPRGTDPDHYIDDD